jgi:exopolysaccharide biosynthesis protein
MNVGLIVSVIMFLIVPLLIILGARWIMYRFSKVKFWQERSRKFAIATLLIVLYFFSRAPFKAINFFAYTKEEKAEMQLDEERAKFSEEEEARKNEKQSRKD